jgi:uncharacterized repeat protein (TIGR03803 family)
LYNFTNGSDWKYPSATLTLGNDGNFYGMTSAAGPVFRITTNGVFTTVGSPPSVGQNQYDQAGVLALGSDGNFYGTIPGNSSVFPQTFYGAVFKMTTNGTATRLASFNIANGAFPLAGLTQGNDGNFYGTTWAGGSYTNTPYTQGIGTVFKMMTNGTLTTLKSFSGFDGFRPEAPLTLGKDNNFYGTTYGGGGTYGSVFKITASSTLTPLYYFNPPLTNGANPSGPLTLGVDGNFYGTTQEGGSVNNNGTVFEITTNGTLTTLVNFSGTNGAKPSAGLIFRGDGYFYGTTSQGGTSYYYSGTAFKMTTNGILTTLVNFNRTNGESPNGLTLGVDGNLYGTTTLGGTSNFGTIFRLSLPPIPLTTIQITAPTPGLSVSNASYTITGTANNNANVAVINVLYSLNSGSWNNAVTGNGWTNWSAAVNLIEGTNNIQAYAMDASGKTSATNKLSFNAVLSATLAVSTNGLGSITPNDNGQLLIVGKTYSLSAKAATDFVFTNWTGGIGSPQNILTNGLAINFVMQSNLWLQANFQETTKPTLTVSAPTNNKKLTNALANLIGTTSDNWKVGGVWNQLNGGTWSLASTSNSFTNWTATLTLIAGTNTIKSYAQNWGGNFSTTNNLSVISSNTFRLQLAFNPLPMKTNGFVFNLQLSTGLNGHIQVSTNLTGWVMLTNFIGTNATLDFRDPAATNSSQRFYRAVIP